MDTIEYGFAQVCFHSKLKVVDFSRNSLINNENYGIVLATNETQEYIAKHKGLSKEDLVIMVKHATQKQLTQAYQIIPHSTLTLNSHFMLTQEDRKILGHGCWSIIVCTIDGDINVVELVKMNPDSSYCGDTYQVLA